MSVPTVARKDFEDAVRSQMLWSITGLLVGLIVLIYLQPQGAMALARLMPDPFWIGAGLTGAGVLVFAVRLYRAFR